jgi:hypothetical protein
MIAVPGMLLSLVIIARDVQSILVAKKSIGNWQQTYQLAAKKAWLAEAIPFFGYIVGLIVLTLLVGQKIAIPLFIGTYLVRWSHYSNRVAVAYALAAWLIMVFFYDQVMSLLFHPSYLALWLRPMLPSGFPDWLLF